MTNSNKRIKRLLYLRGHCTQTSPQKVKADSLVVKLWTYAMFTPSPFLPDAGTGTLNLMHQLQLNRCGATLLKACLAAIGVRGQLQSRNLVSFWEERCLLLLEHVWGNHLFIYGV